MRVIAMLLIPLLLVAAKVGVSTESGRTIIELRGRIEPGDTARVRAAAQGRRIYAIRMTSTGGDAEEGIALAYLVRTTRLRVLVDYRCWSACSMPALVALGRGRLLIGPNADIGVHQATDENDVPDPRWTMDTARKLRGYGAPRSTMQDMARTHPQSVTHYYADDLQRMGARMW